MEKSIRSVDLGQIRPNPYQPETRANIPDEIAERFGKSILEHGLLQNPIARQVDGPGMFEMGDGWLRLKGFEWLVKNGHPDYQSIPIVVSEITDQQMADLVMEANTVRKDLTPIEEAHLFKRYIEAFGVSETELAKKHNLTQGAVSNTIRLLQLPEDIQQKVTNNELSGTHARQLLRLNVHPDMQAKVAKDSIERGLSVSALDNQIQSNLWYISESLKPDDGYRSPSFDIKECESCEFRMKIAYPYGDRKSEWRCTRKECWTKKQEAGEKALAAATLKKVKKSGNKILTDHDLSYDKYQRLDRVNLADLDTPGECKACGKTSLFVYTHQSSDPGVKPHTVCLDPACYRRKKTKKTKATNKIKKEQDHQLTAQLGETFKGLTNTKSCLQVLARHELPRLSADGKLDLCSIFPDMPKLGNGRLDMDALLASLGKKSLEELMRLATAATFTTARRNQCWDYSTELKDNLKRDFAILTGTLSKYEAEVRKFQEENCRGCGYAEEELIGTGEECCRNRGWAKSIGKDGKCQGRRERRKEEVAVA